jgi:hypothetical protein
MNDSEDDVTILFPVPGNAVTCGNRTDLPRKARVHDFVPLGTDTRNCGSRGFRDCEISACCHCGRDRKKEL